PARPARQPVNRVAALGLVQRQPVTDTLEPVDAVPNPVRPREQQLTPAGVGELVGRVAIDQLAAAGRVGTEAGADFGHHGSLVAEGELELLAGRRDRHRRITTRSLLSEIIPFGRWRCGDSFLACAR